LSALTCAYALVFAAWLGAGPGCGGATHSAGTPGSAGASGSGGGAAGQSTAGVGAAGFGGHAGTAAAGAAGSTAGADAGPAADTGPSIDTGATTDAPASGGDAPLVDCPGGGTGTQLLGSASLLDLKTCLVWQRAPSTTNMTNKRAGKFCAALEQDGWTDWRVPAPEELATWPNIAANANANAYVTNPIYIPIADTVMAGCTGDSHSCNIAEYNAGSLACAWQGVDFAGPFVCVRGTAKPSTTATAYSAATCDACRSHVGGAAPDVKIADCLPYAN
jgi:hypothetical protein